MTKDLVIGRGRPLAGPARHVARRLLLGLVGLFLVALAGFLGTGGRLLTVRSGSMTPTIDTGDMILTRSVRPYLVTVGDVVTFRDPTRGGQLVTHRVTKMAGQADRIAFTTKGDANTGVEQWTVAQDGRIGLYIARVPHAGYALAWLSRPAMRLVLVLGAGLGIVVSSLRRIWA